MDTGNGNGWKERSLVRAFLDGFQGIGEASSERIMRIIWVCIALSAAIGVMRGLHLLGWIFFIAYAGILIALEHINNVIERQEKRMNALLIHLNLQNGEWNVHSRYILHQMTAAVLVWGITGLAAGILVLIYNP